MATEIKEYNKLIAERVPPGDRWTLTGDENKIIYTSLTDALEGYLHTTGFEGE